jgi:hypothetical protein
MLDDERVKWEAVQAAPWEPPASLEAALSKVQDPRIWLSHAVDIMAFGDEGVPADPDDQTKKRGYIMEVAARRCQASRALCRAAQSGAVTVMGAGDRDSDASEKISSDYFDTPRQLGSENNSLETDPDRISADRPIRARHGHTKWFNVRIEKHSFLNWLERALQNDLDSASNIPPSDQSYHSMRQYGGGKQHAAVFDAMAEVWRDHRVPKSLSINAIVDAIKPGMQRRGFTSGASGDNIRRILGLKN